MLIGSPLPICTGGPLELGRPRQIEEVEDQGLAGPDSFREGEPENQESPLSEPALFRCALRGIDQGETRRDALAEEPEIAPEREGLGVGPVLR